MNAVSNSQSDPSRRLSGWLILLIFILAIGSVSGVGREITSVRKAYQPYFADYPTLPTVVIAYQCVIFASACAALYTAWLLFRRIPRTLAFVKRAFLLTIALRAMGGWVFDFHPSLPNEFRDTSTTLAHTFMITVYGAVWYFYLARSKRVKELYGSYEAPVVNP
jgi:hypothetical protein